MASFWPTGGGLYDFHMVPGLGRNWVEGEWVYLIDVRRAGDRGRTLARVPVFPTSMVFP